jgi:hypothetical protein
MIERMNRINFGAFAWQYLSLLFAINTAPPLQAQHNLADEYCRVKKIMSTPEFQNVHFA